jgi:hypothetical protein
MTVDVTTRDVTLEFNFSKSCNCFKCWKKPQEPHPDTPVFINKNFEAEPFKKVRKVSESRRIANERVVDAVEGRLREASIDLERAILMFEAQADMSLKMTRDRGGTLTVAQIHRINTSMETVLKELESDPV